MISARYAHLALCGAAILVVSACSSRPVEWEDASYWQRANVSESAYMEGPKALQMLHRDISRCVTEIHELEHLGTIRYATPSDKLEAGRAPDPSTPQGQLDQWETPERFGALYAEHSDYHDFETCMAYKGWERVEHVPYDVAERARQNYIENIIGEEKRSKTGDRQSNDSYLNF